MEKERKKSEEEISLIRYLELGRKGYYPLFFKEWIEESVCDGKIEIRTSSLPTMKAFVYETFCKLHKHKNLERQKSVLQSMSEVQRRKFIKSFIYLVEMRTLDRIETFH